MTDLNEIAPAFVKMAHEIVWCSAATVDAKGRPRSRVLHPIWQWEGGRLTGWIATGATPIKRAHLEASPHLSCNYWAPTQDTCVAECRAEWVFDDEGRRMVWDLFANGPAPVGYDPAMIPGWDNALSPTFAALRLDPWRLRVMPGTALMQGTFEARTWRE
ncbi:MAG: pyridoxamine 5'-phosphate oxidase family protein [Gammaproteobacteria bacterium]|nr:pyridoxamine 5'-phosphate oxidase family protein [Gammaproteobacteria bacterium]